MHLPNFAFLPEMSGGGVVVFVFLLLTLLGVICQRLLENNMIYASKLIVQPSLT